MKAYSYIEDIMLPSSSPSPADPGYQPSQWHPLVIALVGAICTMFLLLSYHKILCRHCCAFRVSTRPENNMRRRLNEANDFDPSQQFESIGLESFVARSLPIVQFKKKGDAEMNGINTDCAVCLGEFDEGDWIKHLPNCSHVFHVACIDIWFQTHSSCPMCRAHIFDLEYSYDLLETLPRERFHDQERPSLYEMLQVHDLQNPSAR